MALIISASLQSRHRQDALREAVEKLLLAKQFFGGRYQLGRLDVQCGGQLENGADGRSLARWPGAASSLPAGVASGLRLKRMSGVSLPGS